MFDVNGWLRWKLEGDSALVALLGSADQIMFGYPRSFEVLPIVTFSEMNQPHATYDDDAPITVESYVQIDVWTDDSGTTAIAQAIDALMQTLLFNCEYSSDVPEPDTLFRHRAMRYRRIVSEEDVYYNLSELTVTAAPGSPAIRVTFHKTLPGPFSIDEATVLDIVFGADGVLGAMEGQNTDAPSVLFTLRDPSQHGTFSVSVPSTVVDNFGIHATPTTVSVPILDTSELTCLVTVRDSPQGFHLYFYKASASKFDLNVASLNTISFVRVPDTSPVTGAWTIVAYDELNHRREAVFTADPQDWAVITEAFAIAGPTVVDDSGIACTRPDDVTHDFSD